MEPIFLNTIEEQDFWKSVYVAVSRAEQTKNSPVAMQWADNAIRQYRDRLPAKVDRGAYRNPADTE